VQFRPHCLHASSSAAFAETFPPTHARPESVSSIAQRMPSRSASAESSSCGEYHAFGSEAAVSGMARATRRKVASMAGTRGKGWSRCVAQRAAGHGVGVLAAVEYHLPVDDYVLDALAVGERRGVSRAVDHLLGVEDGHVGEVPRVQQAAVADAELCGRERG